jgi:hypothetical protein
MDSWYRIFGINAEIAFEMKAISGYIKETVAEMPENRELFFN